MTRRLMRPLLLATVLPLVLIACQKQATTDSNASADSAAPSSAMAVSTAVVRAHSLANSIRVSGPATPVEAMQLGVEVSGLRITAVHVDVGQAVKRGQVLLSIDSRMLDADLAQANAVLREAEAGATLAQSNYQRGQALANDRYISAMQLDELRAANVQSQARVGTARAARDTAALRRSFAELRAPADGIISHKLVQPGQVVSAGMELLRLIKNGQLEWRAALSSEQLAQVHVGDVVHLQTPQGETISGRIRAVSPGVDSQTRTGTIYADLPADLLSNGTLQADTFLEGKIDTGSRQMLAIPSHAVILRDGFSIVFVMQDNQTVRQQQVEIIARDGEWVGISNGLNAGDQVVVEGAGFLADGDAVRVVDTGAGAP